MLRAYFEYGRDDVEIVAVNASGDIERHVHLLKYDSTHGTFDGEISGDENSLTINGKTIKRFSTRDPAEIPWGDTGADVVLECTGAFRKRDQAALHFKGGARKVLVSAPSPDADATIVYGVNNDALKAEDKVISVGSCTTNCLAPVVKVLNDTVGIEKGFMTTVHSYTSDQNLLDGSHKDLRRARAAALSMVPTSTGAAKALSLVIPEIEGKLDGVAVRVPTHNVSLVDLTFTAGRNTSADEINDIMKDAASGDMRGVLAVSEDALVSCDFNHNPHSSIFDTTQTRVVGDNFCRIASWYDNEWGFSARMLDVAALVG